MRMSWAAFLLVLPLFGCPAADDSAGGDAADSEGSDGVEDTDADATAADETGAELSGEELYLTLCSPCHGVSGEGTALGYELQHPVRAYSAWVVRNGRPGTEFEGSAMAAYSDAVVSDAQLEEIWDYLDSFPQPATAEGLYLDYCRNCHGIDAAGGVTGSNLHEAEAMLELFEKVREGENPGQYGVRTGYMPAFDTTWLTDAEVQQIADYIATL